MSRCNPNVHLYGASVRWLMDESVYARIPLSSLRHRKMSLSPRAYRQPANSYAFFALPVKSRQRSSLPEESSHNGKMSSGMKPFCPVKLFIDWFRRIACRFVWKFIRCGYREEFRSIETMDFPFFCERD